MVISLNIHFLQKSYILHAVIIIKYTFTTVLQPAFPLNIDQSHILKSVNITIPPFFLLLSMCVCVCMHVRAKSLQSCSTLCDPTDYSPPGSSVHGISHARILEWVAMTSPKGSSQPRD